MKWRDKDDDDVNDHKKHEQRLKDEKELDAQHKENIEKSGTRMM